MNKKYFYLDHVWDIWSVSIDKAVDLNIAFELFRNDIYHGESQVTSLKIDFDQLKEIRACISDEDLTTAVDLYKAFVALKYTEMVELWKNQDTEGYEKLMADFKAAYEADPTIIDLKDNIDVK